MLLYKGQLQLDRKSIASSKQFVSLLDAMLWLAEQARWNTTAIFPDPSTPSPTAAVHLPVDGPVTATRAPGLEGAKKSERQPRPPSFHLTTQIQMPKVLAWIPFSMVPWLNPNQRGVRLGVSWAPVNENFLQLKLGSHYPKLDDFQAALKPSGCFLAC